MATTAELLKSFADWRVDNETRDKRLAICNECEHCVIKLSTKICNQCGCILDFKTSLSRSECPIKKW